MLAGEQEASILARAVKEQERREGEKEGFSAHPADCLAYKFYRDVRRHCYLCLVSPAKCCLQSIAWCLARRQGQICRLHSFLSILTICMRAGH